MGIFSYPVTVAYDELKTECGIDLIQEIGKEVRRTLQIVPAQVRIRH